MVGNGNVPLSSWVTVGGVTHCPGVGEQETVVLVKPATTGSLKTAPAALFGPLFVTRIVYVVLPPAFTDAVPSSLVMARSTGGSGVIGVFVAGGIGVLVGGGG